MPSNTSILSTCSNIDALEYDASDDSTCIFLQGSRLDQVTSTIYALSLDKIYALFTQSKIFLGHGAYGEVRGTIDYPYIAIKLLRFFHCQLKERKMQAKKLLENEKSSFEAVYGKKTIRTILLNNTELRQYSDLQLSRLSKESIWCKLKNKIKLKPIAFIVMLRIPGENTGHINYEKYLFFLRKVDMKIELSPLNMYLQLYVLLQDKNIYMHDLYNNNMMIDYNVDNDWHLPCIFPVDLSNYYPLLTLYQEEINRCHGLMVEYVENLLKLESYLPHIDLSCFYFSYSLFTKIQDGINVNTIFNIDCDTTVTRQIRDALVMTAVKLFDQVQLVYHRDKEFRKLFSYHFESIISFLSTVNFLSSVENQVFQQCVFLKEQGSKSLNHCVADAYSYKKNKTTYNQEDFFMMKEKIKKILKIVWHKIE